MKRLTLLTAVTMMWCGSTWAQPPERERPEGDRPAAQEGRRRGGAERDGQGQRPRGPRDGERGQRGEGPPEGRRGPGGPPGFGGPGFGGPGRGGPGGFMAMLPIMVALDADKDGELSAEEISNASAALMKLDKNNDGKIDAAEMRPEFPRGGFGGRPGDGPPQGGPRRPATDQAGGRGAANEGIEGFVARMMNFDKDDDGKLTKDEMPERMQSMMARFDTNKDDMIVREELVAAAKARMGSDRPQQGRPGPEGRGGPPQRRASADQMLQRLDQNKDGFISSDELPEFLKGRMESLDKNSDGKLDKSELESMASQMRNRGGRGPGDGQPGRGQGRGDRPRGGRPQDDKP